MKNSSSKIVGVRTLTILALLASMPMAMGASTWSGSGGDSNWGTSGNWDTPPAATGATLIFDGNTGLTNINNFVTITAGITYNSTAGAFVSTFAAPVTALTLTGGITDSSTATQTLNMPITLATTGQTFSVVSGGRLVFGAPGTTNNIFTFNAAAVTFSGAGEIQALGSTGSAFHVGNASTATALGMSGLNTFIANVPTFSIGRAAANSIASSITLPPTSSITATTLGVGDPSGSFSGSGTLNLNTNVSINATTIVVGQKRGTGTITNATGATVTIRGASGGVSKSTMTIADYNTSNTSSAPTGTVNFTGATKVDAAFSTLTIGTISSGASPGSGAVPKPSGAFTLDGSASTVTADTVLLGNYAGAVAVTATTSVTGTLTLTNGTMTILSALKVGDNTKANNSANIGVANGTVAINGGTLDVSGQFVLGNNTGGSTLAANQFGTLTISGGTVISRVAISTTSAASNPSKSTLNLNGGTLDMTGHAIGATGAPIGGGGGALNFQSGILKNLTELNGGATLIKTGGGTLTLSGTNTYTGTTTISAGTLNVLNTTSGTANVQIAMDAALRGTGTLSAAAISFTGAGNVFPGDATLSALTNGPLDNLTVSSANFGTNGGKLIIRVLSTGPGNASSDSLTLTSSTNTPNAPLVLSGTSKLDLHIQNPSQTYMSNQDVVIVDNSAGADLNTTTFDSVTVTTGSVTGISVLYVDSTFTVGGSTGIVATQTNFPVTNGASTTPSGYNRIVVRFSGAVTPVKIADFRAKSADAGVAVSWTCVSEYQNAGFNIYRRAVESAEWVKINPALIAGRITNPDEKKYSFFDWAPTGDWQYKLESVDLLGIAASYEHFAGSVLLDWNAELAAGDFDADSTLASVQDGFAMVTGVRNTLAVGRTIAAMKHDSVELNQVACREMNAIATSTNPNVAARNVAPSAPSISSALSMGNVGVRWFSGGRVSDSSIAAAKVVYTKPGVMIIPQASMPDGFDVGHVSMQREGRNISALAQVPAGVLVYAPGYQDDYTDKDALFLRKAASATSVADTPKVSGLFASAQPVNVTTPATASNNYHDVYFEYNSAFRPYTFTPWFSNKYLTQGTMQDFVISLPQASSAPAILTLNLWSLTSSDVVNPDHTVQLVINGKVVGESSWDGGNKMIQLSFDVPSGVLIAGNNTVSVVTPVIAGLTSQIAFMHSISTNYTRLLDGSKSFEIVNNSNHPQMFELNNVPSTGAWVVDTRFADRAALVGSESQVQTDGTLRLRFVAASGGSGKFLVTPSGHENLPDSIALRQVKAAKLAGPYLATGPIQFSTGVQPLLMKRAREGIRGAYVDQEQLFDYYNHGRYGPDGIRNAVRSLKPTYLLLVGRTTYDYRNYEGQNIDPLCPAYLVSTSFWAQTTSDSKFGDLGRGYPEVAVGRLPVNNATELSGAINHIVNYTGVPASGMRLHAVADQVDPLSADFGAQLDTNIRANNPDVTWQENYLLHTYQTASEVTAAMKAAANGGADLLIYSGHGNAARLGNSTTILDATIVQQWTGNTVFLQATCTANWMAKNVNNYKSIAIQALTQNQGGISASVGTSTYMNPDAATAFMSQLIKNTNRNNARWGNVLLSTQQWAARQTQNGFYTDLMNTEQLFGDPAMPVFAPKVNTNVQGSSAAGTF